MPRERPAPEPFEPDWLERSLNRYLLAGLVFMAALIAGFGIYRAREPNLRATALREQQVTYVGLGQQLFADNCASCHGRNGAGGDSPRLNAKEFLSSVTDNQMRLIIFGGVSGTEMPAWNIDYGGTLTDQQISEIVTYIRSWEPNAPSVPNWRQGATAPVAGSSAAGASSTTGTSSTTTMPGMTTSGGTAPADTSTTMTGPSP